MPLAKSYQAHSRGCVVVAWEGLRKLSALHGAHRRCADARQNSVSKSLRMPLQRQAVGPRGWPELRTGSSGEPRLHWDGAAVKGLEPQGPAVAFEADAVALLRRAQAVAAACEHDLRDLPAAGDGALRLERTMRRDDCVAWMLHERGAPQGTCSQITMRTSTPVDALVYAIYSAEQRLQWDASSFAAFEELCPGVPQPGAALGDVIYCRMPAPSGMAEREVVQERFLLRLPEDGGFAIVMASPSEAASAEHVRRRRGHGPTVPAVRARTALSAYILRPAPGGTGVQVTAMSQTDLGGNVPSWAQAMAKKLGCQRLVQWSHRLRAHCASLAPELASPGGLDAIVAASPVEARIFGAPGIATQPLLRHGVVHCARIPHLGVLVMVIALLCLSLTQAGRPSP